MHEGCTKDTECFRLKTHSVIKIFYTDSLSANVPFLSTTNFKCEIFRLTHGEERLRAKLYFVKRPYLFSTFVTRAKKASGAHASGHVGPRVSRSVRGAHWLQMSRTLDESSKINNSYAPKALNCFFFKIFRENLS